MDATGARVYERSLTAQAIAQSLIRSQRTYSGRGYVARPVSGVAVTGTEILGGRVVALWACLCPVPPWRAHATCPYHGSGAAGELLRNGKPCDSERT